MTATYIIDEKVAVMDPFRIGVPASAWYSGPGSNPQSNSDEDQRKGPPCREKYVYKRNR